MKQIYDQDPETMQSLGLEPLGGKQSVRNPVYLACDGIPDSKDLVLIGLDEDQFLELRMMGPYKNTSPFLDMRFFLAYHQYLPHVVSV